MTITPTENAQTLTLFQQGEIDGAWLPGAVGVAADHRGRRARARRRSRPVGGRRVPDHGAAGPRRLPRASTRTSSKTCSRATSPPCSGSRTTPTTRPASSTARSRRRPASRWPTRSSTRALEHVTFSVDPHADTFETLVANGLAAGTQKDGSIDGLFDLRSAQRHPRSRPGGYRSPPPDSARTDHDRARTARPPPHRRHGRCGGPARPVCSADPSFDERHAGAAARRRRPARGAHRERQQALRRRPARARRTSTSTSRRASSCACSAHRAAASRRCSTSSPDSTGRRPGTSRPRPKARRSCSRSPRSCRG